MKIYYETYGCAVMLGEAERVLEELKSKGYEVVGRPEEADASIIFTCTVRSETEQRMAWRIKELCKASKKLIVTGCLASAQPGLVKMVCPRASIVSNSSLHEIELALKGEKKYLLKGQRPRDWLKGVTPGGFRVVIPIADGCLGNCTFCITKVARPRLVSQRPDSIIEYALKGVKRGAKEIWLTAPDVAAYGKEIGLELPDLLEKLLKVLPENVYVRVGMMSPDTFREVMDRTIDVMRDPRVFKFFHLPLQSASDKVLRLMGRRYTYSEFVEIVNKVRKAFNDPTIATDVMVGFPGEEEDDFELTLKALRELAFERVHLAAYTPRPLTLGARMPQVREDVKSRRVKRAMNVIEAVGVEVHKRYVGGKFKAFVDEYDQKHGTFVARLWNYTPVVLREESSLGEEIVVKIEGATFYDLRGTVWSVS
ncbi:tRNA (N(6)-L-threonylcarbamoyladenosine(37)-C(2))-methylthiotransferase [Ignicoccus hospitalis]|uniref:tRNA-t(6)A37 methylthiotransferase n=1 Tax=Ignicoccus hospitalis (strain KIN4/I / DSM 18386 / JCM 14125) TaxID=453591 RepID=A8ACE3_IGNH4|nr:tRNA (N(6)-L-threonylcarbamoyladenosine(37)-C(2))-methylthiotransferase [Ignicoccus hospitalis]ABU82595.1 RNA modification enzyme, MiaB family [Ignicoccus hospitalis KIN4/I]HIH90760.1 tRNA (N(6)-L-threonylcarbamoyladenosine(37)-C(2))-methylthiotransferase [Desulfurococcaceae archaeon]